MSTLNWVAKAATDPLVAGSTQTILLTATNPAPGDQPPLLTRLEFDLHAGPNQSDLVAPGTQSSIVLQVPAGWNAPTQNGAQFTVTPKYPPFAVTGDVSMLFSFAQVTVNAVEGLTSIDVTDGLDNPSPPLSKWPAGFWVSDLSFTKPATGVYPASTILSWSGADADYTLQRDSEAALPVGSSGPKPFSNLTEDTIFTLRVTSKTGGNGAELERQAIVPVAVPSPVIAFTASPTWVQQGAAVNLTWQVTNTPATGVTIIPQPGAGLPPAGTRAVHPRASTDYSLTAAPLANPAEPQSAGLTIAVYARTDSFPVRSGWALALKGIAVPPGGTHLYSNGDYASTPTVYVTDLRTGAAVASISAAAAEPAHSGWGPLVAYLLACTDGKSVVAISTNWIYPKSSVVAMIDTATNKVALSLSLTMLVTGAALASSGTHLYVTTVDDRSQAGVPDNLLVIDTGTASIVAQVPVGFGTNDSVVAAPAGDVVYVGVGRSGVCVVSTSTNQIVRTLDVGGTVASGGLAVDPEGTRLYVVVAETASVAVFDLASNAVVATISLGSIDSQGTRLVLAPDGRYLYVIAFQSSTMTVIDTTVDLVVASIDLAGLMASGLVVSPDSSTLYIGRAAADISVAMKSPGQLLVLELID